MATRGQLPRLKKAFLTHFAEYGNITAAAKDAGIDRKSVYRWQEQDDTFAAAFREAEIQATETLEAEARRRAVEGLRRLKFEKGIPVLDPATGEPYTELEYSDTLLIFLLKARAPEKYRERHDLTSGGAPLAENLTEDVRAARIQSILERIAARGGTAEGGNVVQ